MTPDLRAFHLARVERLLAEHGIEPGAVMPDRDHALRDDSRGLIFTPPLGGRVLAEGLSSALKLAAAEIERRQKPRNRGGQGAR